MHTDLDLISRWMPIQHDGQCYVPLLLTSAGLLTCTISLQLSTSIRMPNPYRQYRMPDHLNRSRFPVNMIRQQPKEVSTTTISDDSWMAGAPTKPMLQISGLPLAKPQIAYTQRQSLLSLSPKCTETELQASYIPTCPTPENVNPNDLWDEGEPIRLRHPIIIIG